VSGLTKHRESIDRLNGKQKAAIVLMSMGPKAAADITKNLSQEELEDISFEIARMDQVSAELAAAVVSEWGQLETAMQSIAEGGVDYARQILEEAIGPSKAAAVLKRIEGQLRDNVGFNNLRNADAQQVTALIRNEHPQTVALLLAHLQPDQTAAVMKELPTKVGGEVLFRLAKMEKVLPEVLQVLERCYGTESTISISKDLSESGGLEAVANVLNLMTGSVEKELLEHLAWQDQELAEQVKNLMFVFEDLSKLDDRGLQRLLRDVQTKELALALKAATEPLKQRLLGMLSTRAADALREEMEFLGPVRLKDVEAAQANVVKLVRALEESGEIVVSGGEDDMVL
jgi:flagellar motor switch protein FliG